MEKFVSRMKKFALIFLALSLFGCVSARIPQYLLDKNPYRMKYYGSHEAVKKATISSLNKQGWKVKDTADPRVYEESDNTAKKQLLIFTEVKRASFFFGTRYRKMDVYLRSGVDSTDVEVRYLVANSTPIKTFYNYKNDEAVKKFFDEIQNQLDKK